MPELRITKPPQHQTNSYIPKIAQPAPSQVKSLLYDSNDVYLAASNAAVLGMVEVLKRTAGTGMFRIMEIPSVVAGVAQACFSYNSISDSATITKAALPLIQIAGIWFPSCQLIGSVGQFLASTISTAPKLVTCAKNILNKPREAITGIALHLFNIGTQGYIAHEVATEAYQKITTPPQCPTVSKADFAKMKPNERFTAANLDPTCPQHAEIILGVNDKPSCDTIERTFRKMSRIAHPDKGGPAKAFENLAAARNTLNTANKCKA